jgi:hypothetical protein
MAQSEARALRMREVPGSKPGESMLLLIRMLNFVFRYPCVSFIFGIDVLFVSHLLIRLVSILDDFACLPRPDMAEFEFSIPATFVSNPTVCIYQIHVYAFTERREYSWPAYRHTQAATA